jgi:hypothetical protein
MLSDSQSQARMLRFVWGKYEPLVEVVYEETLQAFVA